jgi:hypothetical protein
MLNNSLNLCKQNKKYHLSLKDWNKNVFVIIMKSFVVLFILNQIELLVLQLVCADKNNCSQAYQSKIITS